MTRVSAPRSADQRRTAVEYELLLHGYRHPEGQLSVPCSTMSSNVASQQDAAHSLNPLRQQFHQQMSVALSRRMEGRRWGEMRASIGTVYVRLLHEVGGQGMVGIEL